MIFTLSQDLGINNGGLGHKNSGKCKEEDYILQVIDLRDYGGQGPRLRQPRITAFANVAKGSRMSMKE